MMEYPIGVDSHCHLTLIARTRAESDVILERAAMHWIKAVIDIGLNPNDLDERVKRFADDERVFLSAGYYPDYADEATADDLRAYEEKIRALNENAPVVRLIGEIGLDYFHNASNKSTQIAFFEKALLMAKRLDLPVAIHARDAWEDVFPVVERSGVRSGVFHCFSGSVTEMERAVDLGFHVSFAGNVSYSRSDDLRLAAEKVPADRYLIETDAPYLSHQKVRGRRNEPAFVLYTAETLANLRGITLEKALAESAENAFAMLGVEQKAAR